MSKFVHERWGSWAALLMGLLAFWAWAGAYTLAPGHLAWVMAGLDTPDHYLGWKFFRFSPWQWPLGANPTFGSDAPGSIVLSDGIPCVALALKVVSPLLAPGFQYLGLWGCFCFLMQAWFGRKLMTRITDDATIQLVGAGFFVTATIFMMRVYLHPALAAQWLILAALYLALDRRFRARRWTLLLALAITIHAYLFIMVASVWLADCARRWLGGSRTFSQLVLHGTVTTMIVTLLMWAVGYFMPGGPLGSTFRAHFDLVEPVWTGIRTFGEWSWVVPSMDMDIYAYEGFSYLGLGFIALLVTAAVAQIGLRKFDAPGEDRKGVEPGAWLTLVLVCGVLLIGAIGNHVHFAQRLLFTYPIPSWMDHLYGIFRATARMMWPAWYLLLLATFYLLLRRVRLRYARVIVIVALLVQLGDLSKAAVDVRRVISKSPPWHPVLVSPLWESLPAAIKHIAYMKAAQLPPEMIIFVTNYKVIADYAAQRGMSINMAYLARIDAERLARANAARVELLMRGQIEPSTLYVIDDDPLWTRLSCLPRSGRWLGTVNGLRIVISDTFVDLKSLPAAPCIH